MYIQSRHFNPQSIASCDQKMRILQNKEISQ
jgi:hypothetical protein